MKTNQTTNLKKQTKTLRAVGYCRTSGEGQRDNTSIPRQKKAIEGLAKYKCCQFLKHYVDESKSGSFISGRNQFQRMLRDAERKQFDIIIVYDMKRFGRDGLDILNNAKYLSSKCGVNVVPVQGSFDIQDRRKTIISYLEAGISEDEKISIMDRLIGGRIEKAKEGLRWSPKLPTGRGYERISKTEGRWFVNDEGKQLKEILTRYANGEGMKKLALEYNYPSAVSITRKIREGQLTGIYKAEFHCKDLPEYNVTIPVKAVPEVIPAKLMKRVKDRLEHNRTWNQQHTREYLLTGFLKCQHCGRSLYAQEQKTGGRKVIYYRHDKYYADDRHKNCPFNSIREDIIKTTVLDYLYTFFMDEPAYNKAIENAMPSDDDRQVLESDIEQVKKQLTQLTKQERNFAANLRAGIKITESIIAEQERMELERRVLEIKRDELLQTLTNMPDPQSNQLETELLRLELIYKYGSQDWRELSYEQVRRFLHFLFSDNPKKNGYGVSIASNGLKGRKRKFEISFEGCVEFLDNEELYERHIERADDCLEAIAKLENGIKTKKQGAENIRPHTDSL